jgi:hypothetical protein
MINAAWTRILREIWNEELSAWTIKISDEGICTASCYLASEIISGKPMYKKHNFMRKTDCYQNSGKSNEISINFQADSMLTVSWLSDILSHLPQNLRASKMCADFLLWEYSKSRQKSTWAAKASGNWCFSRNIRLFWLLQNKDAPRFQTFLCHFIVEGG